MIFFHPYVGTVLLFAFCQVVGATKPQTYPAERPTDFLLKIRILFRLLTLRTQKKFLT